MTAIIARSTASERPPLPTDLAVKVASILLEEHAHGALASLHICSKDYYLALSPIIYRRVLFKPKETYALFHLGQPVPAELEDPHQAANRALANGTFFGAESAHLRRLLALRYIKHLTINSLPACSSPLTTSFTSVSSLLHPHLLLPSLQSIQLLPRVADEIRTFIPEKYDRPRNPAFLEALVSSSSPKKLCLAYRVVPSHQWDEHLELTTIKQYQLIARINRLIEDGWASLDTFCVHDIVHQVLPSLRGCKNIYHFSSHCITKPNKPPVFVPPGLGSTYLPGPKWNFRSWQIGTAIKNLFPSGVNVQEVLEETSWDFVNHEGHIITKPENDDDDDTGVGYLEVGRLVADALKTGLPQELAGRDGFKGVLAEQIMAKMVFTKESTECPGCSRIGATGAIISKLSDIL